MRPIGNDFKLSECCKSDCIDCKKVLITAIAIYVLIALTTGVLCVLSQQPGIGQFGFGITQLDTAALVFSCITLAPWVGLLIFGSVGYCIAKVNDCMWNRKHKASQIPVDYDTSSGTSSRYSSASAALTSA